MDMEEFTMMGIQSAKIVILSGKCPLKKVLSANLLECGQCHANSTGLDCHDMWYKVMILALPLLQSSASQNNSSEKEWLVGFTNASLLTYSAHYIPYRK